jgi:hypothetical protein
LVRKEQDLLLKGKFEPKTEEIQGDVEINTRKGDLHDLYSASNIIRVIKSPRMKRVVHMASMGVEKRSACRILVEEPDKIVTTWIPRNRWEGSIKYRSQRPRIG